MALVSDMVFSLLILASGVFAASTVGFAVAWVRARERAIRAEQRAGLAPAGDARSDRLEQAMEDIAVEVERLSEGQRFVGDLLAARAGRAADGGARPAQAVTAR